jgi:hypothetical protein
VTLWTIDADPGTDGRTIAAALAERAGVPFLDEELTMALASALGITYADALAYERGGPSRARVGLAIGMGFGGSGELAQAVRHERYARRTMLEVVRSAASLPCVVLGRCGYLALRSHPGAVHVRISAPASWRATRIAATRCIPCTQARRAIAIEDRRRRRVRKWLAEESPPDTDAFHVICDARRLSHYAIVALLLAAGGVPVADRLEAVVPAERLTAVQPASNGAGGTFWFSRNKFVGS